MTSHKLRRHILPIAALTLMTLILPLPTLHYGYLLEDYYYLRSYTLDEVITTFYSHWEPTLNETRGYRPLHSVQYALFNLLIGGDPVSNHFLHLALMLMGYYLIYLLIFRCTRDADSAFWSALIYACLGSTAWQVSWLVNRQHLLLVIFFMTTLIFYDRYLLNGFKSSWWWSLVFFLLALLLKEAAVSLPLLIFFFAIILRKKTISSQLKPLLPFFVIILIFVIGRPIIIAHSHIPSTNPNPPPLKLTPGCLSYNYGRSLLATFLQSHGVRSPTSKDFPTYGTGVTTPRDCVSLISGLIFFTLGWVLLFSRGSNRSKNTFYFGLSFLLTATIMVSFYYRTNRLFLSSLGLAIMAGTIVPFLFQNISLKFSSRRCLIGVVALPAFLIYFSVNIVTYLEIQNALRPTGYLARTWDRWIYQEKLFLWMKDEQIVIYKRKLIQTGRSDLLKKLNEAIAKTNRANSPDESVPFSGGEKKTKHAG